MSFRADVPAPTDLFVELWEQLRDAGLPEVMLYLADGSACRCHWDQTALIGDTRVALLSDQERGIVRIMPLSTIAGLGVAAPKGTDPQGYRSTVQELIARARANRAPFGFAPADAMP